MKDEFNTARHSSDKEIINRNSFFELYSNCPIPENELLENIGLFMSRRTLSRTLFMHELYQKIMNVHGVIMEFGVRWGKDLVMFENFRGIYEPYNYNRKIIGFDTFEGFPSVNEKDGNLVKGAYSVTADYDTYLSKVLNYHESESPISHIQKHKIIKGNAVETLEKYLKEHPETIISLAYFDFDIYEPTKKCLELIRGHLTKGSIIGFDELNVREFAGETMALKEVFGLDKYSIRRSHISPLQSYIVVE
ncbi:crotonobetainyl-CoA--carnitine CoA-transferase [Lutibacter sp. B2]|nr:crotonobetainyl-CoA--carnitine CoA-transferase [Lutibacter sp. B2]